VPQAPVKRIKSGLVFCFQNEHILPFIKPRRSGDITLRQACGKDDFGDSATSVFGSLGTEIEKLAGKRLQKDARKSPLQQMDQSQLVKLQVALFFGT
jgi:hypothetical protein